MEMRLLRRRRRLAMTRRRHTSPTSPCQGEALKCKGEMRLLHKFIYLI